MASIFTKIINGEIPSYKVAESEHFYAFLDINPNAIGHTLCVPKKEIDKVFDLSEDEYVELMKFSRKVALAVEKVIPCLRVGMSVVGLEVPHVHVHIIPLHTVNDITFLSKVTLSTNEFVETANKISKAYYSL